jgi:hypothetical protein
MANFSKVFTFTLKELFILLEAWFIFLKWDFLISFMKYNTWRNQLTKLNVQEESTTISIFIFEQVKQIIELSEIAGRFHFRKMNCLRRCIVQQKLLEKRGVKARMHIGVRFKDTTLIAHAWLTLQGKIINDSADVSSRYSELKAGKEHDLLAQLT